MATVKELKATARPSVGKGAARAERRAGRVPGVIYGNNQPPRAHLGRRPRTAPAHPGRPVPDHDLRHRSRGQEAPRDSARLPSRSGARLPDPCRLHAARRRRDHPHQRSPARAERGSLAGREARRHRQHRHPHHRARMLGRQHPAIYRGRCRRARDRPLAASVRRQAADRREVAAREDADAGHHRAAVGLRRRAEGGCGCRCGCVPRCCCRLPRLRLRRLALLRGCGGCAPAAAAKAPAAGAKAPAGGGDKKK